jgi:hypothetical protein
VGANLRIGQLLATCVSFTAACVTLLANSTNFKLRPVRTAAHGKSSSGGTSTSTSRSGGGGRKKGGGGGKRRRDASSSSEESESDSSSDDDGSEESESDRKRARRSKSEGKRPKKDKKKKKDKDKAPPRKPKTSEKLLALWKHNTLCFTHMQGGKCPGRKNKKCRFEHSDRDSKDYRKYKGQEPEYRGGRD